MRYFLAALALAGLTTAASADDNIGDVRRSVESRGGTVYWGKHFDHAEYAKAAAAIAAGQGGTYAVDLAKDIGKTFVKEIGLDLLNKLVKGETIDLGNVEIQGGIATYNHWRRVVHHEPRIRWQGIKSRVEMCEVVHEIPLPNTHQLYLRIKKK